MNFMLGQMLKYNKSYAWLMAPLFALMIFIGVILFAIGLGRMVLLVPVCIMISLNVVQRGSGVAFDKWWKTTISKEINPQEFKDAIGKQTQMQVLLAVIAVIVSIK